MNRTAMNDNWKPILKREGGCHIRIISAARDRVLYMSLSLYRTIDNRYTIAIIAALTVEGLAPTNIE